MYFRDLELVADSGWKLVGVGPMRRLFKSSLTSVLGEFDSFGDSTWKVLVFWSHSGTVTVTRYSVLLVITLLLRNQVES